MIVNHPECFVWVIEMFSSLQSWPQESSGGFSQRKLFFVLRQPQGAAILEEGSVFCL